MKSRTMRIATRPIIYPLTVIILVTPAIFNSYLVNIHVRGQSSNQTARKIDSYGDLKGDDEMARLDNFDNELKNVPGSVAYIITYSGRDDPPGRARRLALRSKNYLVNTRGRDPNKIVAINGGRREELTTELWVVPMNAPAPVPTPTISEQNDTGDNLLYDEFGEGVFMVGHEDENSRLGGFAEALKKEPRSWGCVIAYAQGGDDRMGQSWDLPGTGRKIAISIKNTLVKDYHFAPSKITAVDGGYSTGQIVSLWIVRPNARYDSGPFIYSGRLKTSGRGVLTTLGENPNDICCRACTRGHRDPYIR